MNKNTATAGIKPNRNVHEWLAAAQCQDTFSLRDIRPVEMRLGVWCLRHDWRRWPCGGSLWRPVLDDRARDFCDRPLPFLLSTPRMVLVIERKARNHNQPIFRGNS